jgi:hypothetical protein
MNLGIDPRAELAPDGIGGQLRDPGEDVIIRERVQTWTLGAAACGERRPFSRARLLCHRQPAAVSERDHNGAGEFPAFSDGIRQHEITHPLELLPDEWAWYVVHLGCITEHSRNVLPVTYSLRRKSTARRAAIQRVSLQPIFARALPHAMTRGDLAASPTRLREFALEQDCCAAAKSRRIDLRPFSLAQGVARVSPLELDLPRSTRWQTKFDRQSIQNQVTFRRLSDRAEHVDRERLRRPWFVGLDISLAIPVPKERRPVRDRSMRRMKEVRPQEHG